MKMQSFNAYHSYLQSMELLSDAERGRLFTALLIYSATGERPRLKGNERYVFPHMRCQIDRDRAAYESKCSVNAENGRKGGRPRKERPCGSLPPELSEVRAFCRARNSTVNPERFYEFYSSGHWLDSRGKPVINWKQKILSWESYGPENPFRQPNFGSIDMNKLIRNMEEIG